MAKFLILASATALQGLDAYTWTNGHVSCWAVKLDETVGMLTVPAVYAVKEIKGLTEFELTTMVTVDHVLRASAWVG